MNYPTKLQNLEYKTGICPPTARPEPQSGRARKIAELDQGENHVICGYKNYGSNDYADIN